MVKDQQNKTPPFIFYLIVILLLLLISFAFWNTPENEPTQSLQGIGSLIHTVGVVPTLTFKMNPEAKDFRVYFFELIKNKP